MSGFMSALIFDNSLNLKIVIIPLNGEQRKCLLETWTICRDPTVCTFVLSVIRRESFENYRLSRNPLLNNWILVRRCYNKRFSIIVGYIVQQEIKVEKFFVFFDVVSGCVFLEFILLLQLPSCRGVIDFIYARTEIRCQNSSWHQVQNRRRKYSFPSRSSKSVSSE